jgi:hypothetical protein
MAPVHLDPQAADGRSQLVCGRCGKPSTVLVLDPGKPYVYLCASCEADSQSEVETARTSNIDSGRPA